MAQPIDPQIHRWLTELTPGKSITLIPPKGKSLPTNWANGLDAVSHEQGVGFALLYDWNDSGRRIIVVTKAKKEE